MTDDFIPNGDEDVYGDVIRDGSQTNTQDYQAPNNLNEDASTFLSRRRNQLRLDRGLHESFAYYDDCYVRERNTGEWRIQISQFLYILLFILI